MRSGCVLLLSLCLARSGFVPSAQRGRLLRSQLRISPTAQQPPSSNIKSNRGRVWYSKQKRRGLYSRHHHKEQNRSMPEPAESQLMCPQLYEVFRPQAGVKDREKRIRALLEVKTNRFLTTVLKSWAKSGNKAAADVCKEVLDHLKIHEGGNLAPNEFVYGVTIDAYARRNQAERAEAVLRELLVEGGGDASMIPSRISFNCVIKAWSRSNAADGPDRCQALLREMSQLAKLGGMSDLAPDVVTYTSVIGALAKQGRAPQAEELFREMCTAGDERALPNARTYATLIHAWAKSRAPDAFDKCMQLLTDMYKLAEEDGRTDLEPTVVSYTTTIDAFAKRGEAVEAEKLLRRMLRDGPLPNRVTFNSVINAWSKSDAGDAQERCQGLLSEMKTLAKETGRADLCPDVVTYTSLIDVLATRGHAEAAEDVLRGMLNRDQDKDPAPTPNAITVAAVMNAWAKSDADDAPDQCRRLLAEIDEFAGDQTVADGDEVLRPNVVAYNAVVNAYAKRGRAREAEKLLREMLDESNDKPYPDVVTFTSVMHAWANSEVVDAPEQCKRLLQEMRDLAKASTGRRRYQCQPSMITYNTVITAYGKRGLAAEAENLLREMLATEKPPPSVATFSAAMLAWSKSPHVDVDDAIERCENLFAEMTMLAEQGGRKNLLPQQHTYGIMMTLYEKAGRYDKVEELRQRLEQHKEHHAKRRKRT